MLDCGGMHACGGTLIFHVESDVKKIASPKKIHHFFSVDCSHFYQRKFGFNKFTSQKII